MHAVPAGVLMGDLPWATASPRNELQAPGILQHPVLDRPHQRAYFSSEALSRRYSGYSMLL